MVRGGGRACPKCGEPIGSKFFSCKRCWIRLSPGLRTNIVQAMAFGPPSWKARMAAQKEWTGRGLWRV